MSNPLDNSNHSSNSQNNPSTSLAPSSTAPVIINGRQTRQLTTRDLEVSRSNNLPANGNLPEEQAHQVTLLFNSIHPNIPTNSNFTNRNIVQTSYTAASAAEQSRNENSERETFAAPARHFTLPNYRAEIHGSDTSQNPQNAQESVNFSDDVCDLYDSIEISEDDTEAERERNYVLLSWALSQTAADETEAARVDTLLSRRISPALSQIAETIRSQGLEQIMRYATPIHTGFQHHTAQALPSGWDFHQRISEISLGSFPQGHAIPFQPSFSGSPLPRRNSECVIDVIALKKNPRKELKKLGMIDLQHGFPRISYGSDVPAVDVGGVTRDLGSQFGTYLWQEKDTKKDQEGFLLLENGFPIAEDKGDKKILKIVGKLMALCYADHQGLKMGPLFPGDAAEKIYSIISSYCHVKLKNQDLQLWNILSYLKLKNAHLDDYSVLDLQKELGILTAKDLETLTILVDEGNEVLTPEYFQCPQNRKKLRDKLLQDALEDPRLNALQIMSKAMLKSSTSNHSRELRMVTSTKLQEKIEGKLSAELLSLKLDYQKALSLTDDGEARTQIYLSEWIHSANKNTLQQFLQAVTGCRTLGSQKIIINMTNQSENFFPVGHTCFYTLDLPGNYPSQEHFNQKIEEFLLYALDGKGFQQM